MTQWLFHLPPTPTVDNSISLQATTSAITTSGNNISHQAIASAYKTRSGSNISHKAITSAYKTNKQWQQHQPQGYNICPEPQDGNNISHPGNNISQNKTNTNGTILVQLYQCGNNFSHKKWVKPLVSKAKTSA